MTSRFFGRCGRTTLTGLLLALGALCATPTGPRPLAAQTVAPLVVTPPDATPTAPGGGPALAAGAGGGPARAGGLLSRVSATMGLAETMAQMRGRALNGEPFSRLGVSEECDYDRFVSLIQDGSSSLSTIRSMKENGLPKGRWGLPTVDALEMILQVGGTLAQAASARAERQGLIEHVEQMCQTSVQQDEMARQLELTRQAKQGTDRAIRPLLGNLQLTEVRESLERNRTLSSWTARYHEATPVGALAQDTLWRQTDRLLQTAQTASIAMHQRLDEMQQMLDVAHNQLYEPADEAGVCASGQRAPAGADTLHLAPGVDRLACGPVSDERATQVLGEIDLLKAQAKGIQVASVAWLMHVKHVDVTTGTVLAKRQEYTRQNFQMHGY